MHIQFFSIRHPVTGVTIHAAIHLHKTEVVTLLGRPHNDTREDDRELVAILRKWVDRGILPPWTVEATRSLHHVGGLFLLGPTVDLEALREALPSGDPDAQDALRAIRNMDLEALLYAMERVVSDHSGPWREAIHIMAPLLPEVPVSLNAESNRSTTHSPEVPI